MLIASREHCQLHQGEQPLSMEKAVLLTALNKFCQQVFAILSSLSKTASAKLSAVSKNSMAPPFKGT